MLIREKLYRGAAGLLLALILTACATRATEPVEQQAPVAATPEVVAPAVEAVEEVSKDFAADDTTPLDAFGRPLSRTFYFAYDQAILSAQDLAALELHAQILRRNADRRVLVTGHCDERGTREYNLALGERRANAVSSFLLAAGVSAGQIEVVSYGEERPQDPGHDASAWARNRRAVVSYF